jgi:hypothetical protein
MDILFLAGMVGRISGETQIRKEPVLEETREVMRCSGLTIHNIRKDQLLKKCLTFGTFSGDSFMPTNPKIQSKI